MRSVVVCVWLVCMQMRTCAGTLDFPVNYVLMHSSPAAAAATLRRLRWLFACVYYCFCTRVEGNLLHACNKCTLRYSRLAGSGLARVLRIHKGLDPLGPPSAYRRELDSEREPRTTLHSRIKGYMSVHNRVFLLCWRPAHRAHGVCVCGGLLGTAASPASDRVRHYAAKARAHARPGAPAKSRLDPSRPGTARPPAVIIIITICFLRRDPELMWCTLFAHVACAWLRACVCPRCLKEAGGRF